MMVLRKQAAAPPPRSRLAWQSRHPSTERIPMKNHHVPYSQSGILLRFLRFAFVEHVLSREEAAN